MTKAPKSVKDLVARFERNVESYRASTYNEAQVRKEFIDPLFEALGWDVQNTAGYAEPYKDVIHEDAIKVGGVTKAPDYCFRIGGARKFFLEAKKPSVDIKGDVSPAYQLRRYAWSSKLPLSILTDFEEFAVYDCRIRPTLRDKVGKARVLYLRCTEYADQWDQIASIFSKEAVLQGSFDKYAETTRRKRGTSEVDAEFLKEIERWREALARNLALRNRRLSVGDLNFAVQRTIDRILFLRMCEDRGIEPYGRLQALVNGSRVYRRLIELFYHADDRYNSGLFHFRREKDRASHRDELTPDLKLDDKALRGILGSLYYPDCSYEFSVLPAEILGNVYEQFLGKVIRLTKGHRARVEDKPEVKKAGGVYYTPRYIVDYIVKNTLGKLCDKKTPRQIAKLRILDPACGSGSFLLGAYQHLLDYHRDWYVEHGPKKHTKQLYRGRGGEWFLTTAEKKRILLNNIHGVDIDTQAVEVTKLSLLLKVLENENQETLQRQLKLWHERALPDLGRNIKCGNSLIGPDFYKGKQMALFDDEERQRINAFDWEAEFPEVFGGRKGTKKGRGFDAVIGNPPYIRIQNLRQWAPEEVEFYKERYVAAGKGNYDIYVVFVERGLSFLNPRGRLGFILPHKFFNAKYGEPLRGLIAEGSHLAEVVHFGDQQIFTGGTTYTCLLFLDKQGATHCRYATVEHLADWRGRGRATERSIPATRVSASDWNFVVGKGAGLFDRLGAISEDLGSIAERIFQGFKTGADPVFILEREGQDSFFSKQLGKVVQLEPTLLRPLYKSGELKRYHLRESNRAIIFPYKMGRLLDWEVIERMAPKTARYLQLCKGALDSRERGRWRGRLWYRYSRTQALQIMKETKILTADLNPSANFCIDPNGTACFTGGAAGGYGILVPERLRLYILALLNSKLLDWYLQKISSRFRGGWFSYESKYISRLPIRLVDSSERLQVRGSEEVQKLAGRMLDLQGRSEAARTPSARVRLEREIRYTDEEIDRLVYELYGLNDEEIAIVEEAK